MDETAIFQDRARMARKNISFPKIEPVTLRDKVVVMLKEAFFAGTLKPGDLIIERQLSRQLNIGTPAIREALFTLQEQGFVQRVVNTGTYVNEFTYDKIWQMYLLRTELELLALRWAKSRVTENDLLGLEKAVEGIVEEASGPRAGRGCRSGCRRRPTRCGPWTSRRMPWRAGENSAR